MKSDLLHRIAAIEAEMVGELDLRAVVSTPMPQPEHRLCDECETVDFCRSNGCIPKQPDPRRARMTFWQKVGLLAAPAAAILFALAWIWPH